ncbi:hypothetical protein [Streptomyces sp. SP2-10]|uniref:hypothetical protein n=1 Tax=Streptomyces sp. SP2-10 TaxID=2873385 RepID=UPI001CA7A16A|nr:hypothetical protein [Streptomyces sp. SP2-10]MBY8842187.1 hypothetical protein [Streptomyces sp. SP2-10]
MTERIGTERAPAGDTDPPRLPELSAACVPAEFGGALDDYGRLHRLLRSFARRDPAAAAAQAGAFLAVAPVWVSGDTTVARRIAGPVAAGARVSCGLTRADAVGPDAGLSAYPTRDGYRLDGEERLTGGLADARFVSVLARTSPVPGPRAYSLLLFETRELSADACRPVAAASGAVAFRDARVGADALVGREGAGIEVLLKADQVAWSVLSAVSLGSAERALRAALSRVAYPADGPPGDRSADGSVSAWRMRELTESYADVLLGEVLAVVGVRALHLLTSEMSVTSAVVGLLVPALAAGVPDRLRRLGLPRGPEPADGREGDPPTPPPPHTARPGTTGTTPDTAPARDTSTPDASAWDTSASATSASGADSVRDASASDTSASASSASATAASGADSVRNASASGAAASGASVPETSASQTSGSSASAPDASVPETSVPDADPVPGTSAPDASAPDLFTPGTFELDALAGTALCPALLVAQFRPLARDYLSPSEHRPRLARLFGLGGPVPPLDPDRLALLSRYGSAVLGTLPGSVAHLRELACGNPALNGVAALAGQLLTEAEVLHHRMAAAAPTAGRTPPGSLADARAYALCFAGAACLGVWLGNHGADGPPTDARDGSPTRGDAPTAPAGDSAAASVSRRVAGGSVDAGSVSPRVAGGSVDAGSVSPRVAGGSVDAGSVSPRVAGGSVDVASVSPGVAGDSVASVSPRVAGESGGASRRAGRAVGHASEALWRDGLWLEACLARVLAHLGVRRPRVADEVLFDRLAEPLITQYEEGSDFSVLHRPTPQESSSC